MNKIIYFLILFLTFTAYSFGDVLYKLDIYINLKDETLHGKAVIKNETQKTVSIDTQNLSLKTDKTVLNPGETLSLEFKKDISKNLINGDFLYLLGNWYPKPDTLAVYSLTVDVPADFTAISEAEEIKEEKNKERKKVSFIFKHPLEEVNLIASSRFVVKEKTVKGIKLYTYFFKEDSDIAEKYLEKTAFYINEYIKLLGRFPYKRFSVVENILPTGYSFPTFTLIGKQIIRYSFILNSSLPHEILHQWFGCSVYVDYEKGNWSEGLTTYLSDHMFSKDPVLYRKNLILKYMAFVNKENEYPLSEFIYKKTPVDEAIGYGKGAMVFHMLRKRADDRDFIWALRRFIVENQFKKASWFDIKAAFEKTLGTDLRDFFKQWVYKKGIPSVEISDASSYLNKEGVFQIDVTLKTDNDFSFTLPVEIKSYMRKKLSILDTSVKENSILMKDIPLTLFVDKDYDVFRKLSKDEIPPVLYFLLGEKEPIFIVEKETLEKYRPLIEKYKNKKIIYPENLEYRQLEGKNVFVLDKENPALLKIFGKKETEKGFFIKGYKNPFSEEKSIFIIHSPDKKTLRRFLPLIKHYGKYTYVSFGKNRKKEYKNPQDGIKIILNEPSVIQSENGIIKYAKLIPYLYGMKVIYIGEQHTKFSHHIIQYQLIKDLHQKGLDIAIGMEMFSRSFQKYIDQYIKGQISEEEFLKKTKYFTQWKYDYNYYKPILRYARENHIPVLGLNLDVKIIEKVARKGIDSLSKEEKKKLPKEIDFSNLEYKKHLYRIYALHSHGDLKHFINFYQSQLLWDETMAETAAEYLKKHPEKTLVILAGNGHLMYGYGIPDRLYRRYPAAQIIILQDEQIEKGKGDFFIYNEPFKGELSKKLGVYVEETKEGLKVDSVIKTSIAEKAGIKKGDIIVAFNGKPIKNLADLKVLLINPPKESKITVLRKGKKITLKVLFD